MSIYSFLETLHEAMKAQGMSENDRHFIMDWFQAEFVAREHTWRGRVMVGVLVGALVGLALGWFH